MSDVCGICGGNGLDPYCRYPGCDQKGPGASQDCTGCGMYPEDDERGPCPICGGTGERPKEATNEES